MSQRILVVDDSRTTRDLVAELLRAAGFEVVTGANGEEGVATALRERPDLIVSDVQMPIVDGFGLCEKLKANAELSRVPILLLTRFDDPTAILRGLQVGADGFLVKKGGLKHVVPRVKRALKDGSTEAARKRGAVGTFSASLKLSDGRRESFRVLFDSMTREAPFDMLSLLVLDAKAKPQLFTVSRAQPSPELLKETATQMSKTAALVAGHEIVVPAGAFEAIVLDSSLPPLKAAKTKTTLEEAIKVPLWDEGELVGQLGVFDLSGEVELEDNIRYFFDLGIEFARALRAMTKAS